jgi:hypothetical protein
MMRIDIIISEIHTLFRIQNTLPTMFICKQSNIFNAMKLKKIIGYMQFMFAYTVKSVYYVVQQYLNTIIYY